MQFKIVCKQLFYNVFYLFFAYLSPIVQYVRGITHAMVMFEEGTPVMPSTFSDHSSYAQSQTSSGDQLGIIANLQPLITISNDLSILFYFFLAHQLVVLRKERPRLITMEMGGNKVVYLHRIGEAYLVCVCKKNVKSPTYEAAINHSVVMLSKGTLLDDF